jgi:hypothetical protein
MENEKYISGLFKISFGTALMPRLKEKSWNVLKNRYSIQSLISVLVKDKIALGWHALL